MGLMSTSYCVECILLIARPMRTVITHF